MKGMAGRKRGRKPKKEDIVRGSLEDTVQVKPSKKSESGHSSTSAKASAETEGKSFGPAVAGPSKATASALSSPAMLPPSKPSTKSSARTSKPKKGVRTFSRHFHIFAPFSAFSNFRAIYASETVGTEQVAFHNYFFNLLSCVS